MCGEGFGGGVVCMLLKHQPSSAPAFLGISLEVKTPGHRAGGVAEVKGQSSQTRAALQGIVIASRPRAPFLLKCKDSLEVSLNWIKTPFIFLSLKHHYLYHL